MGLGNLFHLAGATMQIVTQLSEYQAVFFSTGIIVAFSSIFVFLIGRKLTSARVGLLAALVVTLAAEFISLGAAIVPMSLGFCYFLAILYLYLCRDKRTVADNSMILLLLLALIFSHTVAAFITLLCTICIFVAYRLYRVLTKTTISNEVVTFAILGSPGLKTLYTFIPFIS